MSVPLLALWVLEVRPDSPSVIILSPPVRGKDAAGPYRSLHRTESAALAALREMRMRGLRQLQLRGIG